MAKIFWSKDQCKNAIDLFSKDRHNFEHFLQVYAKAAEICDEETLERSGKRSEAEMRLKEANELFQEFHGTHLSTVHALKEMADFYFSDSTENDLEKALTFYKTALDMMKQLGMENNKANIMIMKNYGICFRKKGNFREGTKYLERACFVADRELLPDHNWKVMIKTHLALLYDMNGIEEEAIASMQEGLEMCNRLKKPVKRLGANHSSDVISFLNRLEEYFPQSKFPR